MHKRIGKEAYLRGALLSCGLCAVFFNIEGFYVE